MFVIENFGENMSQKIDQDFFFCYKANLNKQKRREKKLKRELLSK
jgi:hypothetical protein